MVSRLIERLIRFYYVLLVALIKSNHHLRYIAMRCPFADLRRDIWLKMGNFVGEEAYINHSITILDSPYLETNIKLGTRVALSPNITFICYSSPNNSILKDLPQTKSYVREGPIEVGDDTWVGAGVIIHPGVKIGSRCIIGSMSNVTKNIPDDTLAYGNPIKLIRKLNDH